MQTTSVIDKGRDQLQSPYSENLLDPELDIRVIDVTVFEKLTVVLIGLVMEIY